MPVMKSPILFVISSLLVTCFIIWPKLCQAVDTDNLHDTCPTDITQQTIFINGFPCKNPANVTDSDFKSSLLNGKGDTDDFFRSDFKSSLLNGKGDTDDFFRSSMTIVTAAEYPGLNTLSLSVARTDLEVDGLVTPHAHPRASEMLFVSTGVVVAGFIDTNNVVFQRVLREGDVFVFPRGLLHYCLNNGFEDATVFSVLNSQNPGLVKIPGVMFASDDSESMMKFKQRLVSLSRLVVERLENMTSV